MILAYRAKTGCKQYVFTDIFECIDYFAKKIYSGELVLASEYSDTTRKKVSEILFNADSLCVMHMESYK